jgi:hypothetical protein
VRERRQVVDLPPVPAPIVIEYQLVSTTCRCCGVVSTTDWTDTPAADVNAAVVTAPGSAVRIGPRALALCALLTCAHYLPIGRATALLATAAGIDVSTGFVGRVRRRAAARLLATFTPHLQKMLITAPVLHADETTVSAVSCRTLRRCLMRRRGREAPLSIERRGATGAGGLDALTVGAVDDVAAGEHPGRVRSAGALDDLDVSLLVGFELTGDELTAGGVADGDEHCCDLAGSIRRREH